MSMRDQTCPGRTLFTAFSRARRRRSRLVRGGRKEGHVHVVLPRDDGARIELNRDTPIIVLPGCPKPSFRRGGVLDHHREYVVRPSGLELLVHDSPVLARAASSPSTHLSAATNPEWRSVSADPGPSGPLSCSSRRTFSTMLEARMTS